MVAENGELTTDHSSAFRLEEPPPSMRFMQNGMEYNKIKRRPEDPMSHRIIEKRRRDRMNNCLADLSRLIPAEYLKKGRGRIEKTEIIEMAIKHMKYLQAHVCTHETCDLRKNGYLHHVDASSEDKQSLADNMPHTVDIAFKENYRLGFRECLSETMHYLVEIEGFYPEEKMCIRLVNHLEQHCEKVLKGDGAVYNGATDAVTSSNSVDQKMVEGGRPRSDSDSGELMSPMGRGIIIPRNSHSSDESSSLENGNGNGNLHKSGANNSQLREILTGPPHISTVFVQQTRPNIIRKLVTDTSSVQHVVVNEDHHGNGHYLYKFKNDIKERFSAEHSSTSVPNGKPPVVPCGLKRRRSSVDDSSTHSDQTMNESPPPVKMSPHHPPDATSRPVPIFALHSKGAYYIPLTVDSHMLSPFLNDLNYVNAFSSLVLHPVTISVNFQRPQIPSFNTPLTSDCYSQPKLDKTEEWASRLIKA